MTGKERPRSQNHRSLAAAIRLHALNPNAEWSGPRTCGHRAFRRGFVPDGRLLRRAGADVPAGFSHLFPFQLCFPDAHRYVHPTAGPSCRPSRIGYRRIPPESGMDLLRHYLMGTQTLMAVPAERLVLLIQFIGLGLLVMLAAERLERSAHEEGLHCI